MTVFAAIAIAVTAWWISTGLVIMIVRGMGGPMVAIAVASLVALGGAVAIYGSSDAFTQVGVYHGFFGALALWAWHEVTFLTGWIVGPRRIGVAPGVEGKARFRAAFLAIRDHELGLFATGLLLIMLLGGAENPAAWGTYSLLWLMRLSTKLNVFCGAPNAISEILPDRLSYLTSYFRTDRTHPIFIVSVTLIAALMTTFAFFATQGGEASSVLWTLLATFAALALLEHLFLVLPIRDAALWWWAVDDEATKKKQEEKAVRLKRLAEIVP
ncbi:MAG: putative photosynthetic complex assembly protein PuhE [Pseudomonadota bacterium]